MILFCTLKDISALLGIMELGTDLVKYNLNEMTYSKACRWVRKIFLFIYFFTSKQKIS